MKHSILLTSALVAMQGAIPMTDATDISIDVAEPTVQLPTVSHNAFQRGERLEYDVSYGWLDAGEAIIEIKDEKHTIAQRDVLHIIGTGNSQGTFNWFFKVRDRYETYLDEEGVFPWVFVRDIQEGGFKMKQSYTFDHYNQKVKTNKGKEYDVPLGVQDMISSFYSARALDLKALKPGQVFEIQSFVDNELWPLRIKFLKRESITIEKGTFDCMLFVPVVQEGRIFKEEEDMMVWVTDDKNRIPVLAKASVLVGSIKMELRSFKGLANPVSMH
ncbi:MAG: DUF3108 domain-containing protein [Cryomorphaceae bacterium]